MNLTLALLATPTEHTDLSHHMLASYLLSLEAA